MDWSEEEAILQKMIDDIKVAECDPRELLSAEELLRAMMRKNPNLVKQIDSLLKISGIGVD